MPPKPVIADTPVDPGLIEEAARLPHQPGVYIFKATDGEVLYVGKAVDLKNRVNSYFRSGQGATVKTRALVARAGHLEYMVTATEKEALLLESSLIKRHRPRYNVVLRDDKNYPALRIDPREEYPRLTVVRRFERDGALYFGPYHSAHSLRETLKILNRAFPLRQCKGKKPPPRQRPCLNYSMGLCLGVCAGKADKEDYRRIVDEVILFLQGKADRLQAQLKERMESAAASLRFEEAALCRDRLRAIEEVLERQHIISDRFNNQDAIGIFREAGETAVVVLFVRHGALVGQRRYRLGDLPEDTPEILSGFIQQFYSKEHLIPDEILVPQPVAHRDVLEEWLRDQRGRRVPVRPVRRGTGKSLLELAHRNAKEFLKSERNDSEKTERILSQCCDLFGLPRKPHRMACVDVSNIQGRHAVGSVVIFVDGRPHPLDYRRYTVKRKATPDDPNMMAEIVERFLEEERDQVSRLDLFVVDGGKSQLNRIRRLFVERGLETGLPLIAFAKEREKDLGGEGRGFYEKVYLPGRRNPIFLTARPEVLHLLQRLRDEAHRHAVTFYQKRHRRDLVASTLDAVPGIGPKRRRLLLLHFGSVEAIQQADVDALAAVPGIPRPLAASILEHLSRLEERTEKPPAFGDTESQSEES